MKKRFFILILSLMLILNSSLPESLSLYANASESGDVTESVSDEDVTEEDSAESTVFAEVPGSDAAVDSEAGQSMPDADVAESVSDEDTTESVTDEAVTESVSDADVAESVPDEDVAKSVSDEDVAESVSDEDVTESVSDADITEEDSAESTVFEEVPSSDADVADIDLADNESVNEVPDETSNAASIQSETDDVIAVGTVMWIRQGSMVYKSMDDTVGYQTRLKDYQIKIKNIVTDDAGVHQWYEFECIHVFDSMLLTGYKYVKAADTTVTEPGQDSGENEEYKESVTLEDGKTISAGGVLISAANTDSEKVAAIKTDLNFLYSSNNPGVREPEVFILDIDSKAESANIVVSGLTDSGMKRYVTMTHLLDSAEAIKKAVESNRAYAYFETESAQYSKETAAAKEYSGKEGRVYYTSQVVDLADNGDISFLADSFSTFIFTVYFEYEGLTYSLDGKSSVTLESLLESLQLGYTAAQVKEVRFSNPSLIEVAYEKEEWVLTSLASFSTLEYLTIIFEDDEEKTIRVTDPATYYYLTDTGSDWCDETTDVTFQTQVLNGTPTTTNLNSVEWGANDSEIVIYMHPGMSFRALSGTTWPDGTYQPGTRYEHDDSIDAEGNSAKDGKIDWEWIWDGSTWNYAYIHDTEIYNNTFQFKLTVPYEGYNVTNKITIHVIPKKDPPTLLENMLDEIDNYGLSLKSLPVTLYNYSAQTFNANFSGNGEFVFGGTPKGIGYTGTVKQTAVNDGSAVRGIFKSQLDNVTKLPVMSYGDQAQIFDLEDESDKGRTVYPNVDFQFVYEEATGYYTYSSALNHAQFYEDANEIKLYRQSMGHSDGGEAARGGGFYPFTDINKAILGSMAGETESNSNLQEWAEELKTNQGATQPAAQYIKDMVATSSVGSTVDTHFGLQVSASFYLPEYGTLEGTENGTPLEYQFFGDDDLWVFIDGQLVLDIGGAHGPIRGAINLKDGTVINDSTRALAGSNSDTIDNTKETKVPTSYTDDFLKNLQKDRIHTIQIFYLERWCGESNCYMRFNLPIIPEGGVQIQKDVTDQDGNELTIKPDETYTFRLEKSVDGGKEYVPLKNYNYNLNSTSMKTDPEGRFQLKDGQIAIFEGIPHVDSVTNQDVYVRVVEEIAEDSYLENQVVVNDVALALDETSGEFVSEGVLIPSEDNATVKFEVINKIEAAPLEIEKCVVGSLVEEDKKFQFTLQFDENAELSDGAINSIDLTMNSNAISFVLGRGETLRLESVPVGLKYSVTELTPGAGFDPPKYEYIVNGVVNSDEQKRIKAGGLNKVTVTNQQFMDLIIKKQGCREDIDDNQTFLYTVKGKDEWNENVDLDVTVIENGTAVIAHVPVGGYDISEKEDWSWRYGVSEDPTPSDYVVNETRNKIEKTWTFNNERKNPYWLDGNSYCQNVFSANQIDNYINEKMQDHEVSSVGN